MLKVNVGIEVANPGKLFRKRQISSIGTKIKNRIKRRVSVKGIGVTRYGNEFTLWRLNNRPRLFPRAGDWDVKPLHGKKAKSRKKRRIKRKTGWDDFPINIKGGKSVGVNWAFFKNGYQGVVKANAKRRGYRKCLYKLTGAMWKAFKRKATKTSIELAFEGHDARKKAEKHQERRKGRFMGLSKNENKYLLELTTSSIEAKLEKMALKTKKSKGFRGSV